MNKTDELKKIVAEKNTTLDALAAHLGMHRSTLYRKLKGGIEGLTLGEIKEISCFLGLCDSERRNLFGV